MSHYDEVYPVTRITAGSVGDTGRRVFVLQAKVDGEIVSWIIEKDQALALSRSIPSFLEEIQKEFPDLCDPLVAAEPNLSLSEPFDPDFRVSSIGLGYDRYHDLVVLTLEDTAEMDLTRLVDADANDEGTQVFTTRGQALLLGRQAEAVVAAGRPLCPVCGDPIDDFGHFCWVSLTRRKGSGEYLQ